MRYSAFCGGFSGIRSLMQINYHIKMFFFFSFSYLKKLRMQLATRAQRKHSGNTYTTGAAPAPTVDFCIALYHRA